MPEPRSNPARARAGHRSGAVEGRAHVQKDVRVNRGQVGGLTVIGPAIKEQHAGARRLDRLQEPREQGGIGVLLGGVSRESAGGDDGKSRRCDERSKVAKAQAQTCSTHSPGGWMPKASTHQVE